MSDTFYQRNLPHWQPPGATFFITWRLWGSLPRLALEQIELSRKLIEQESHTREIDEELKVRHFKKLFAIYDDLLQSGERAVMA
jgi:hypothetical protein